MEQFKRVQVILLPAEDTVNALKGYTDKSLLFKYSPEYKSVPAEINYVSYFHLYIISDDEIKVGDHVFNIKDNHYGGIVNENNLLDAKLLSYIKKIIATTDTSLGWTNIGRDESGRFIGNHINKGNGNLIKSDLPHPSQQFITKYIEEYNKGNIITDVLVEYEEMTEDELGCDPAYYPLDQRLKLKINPKDNTITIKKLKDSWNREEVSNLIKLFANNYQYASNDIGYNKWIEENL